MNWKATLGSTVKPVEGGRVEERDSWMRERDGCGVLGCLSGREEVFRKREHTGGRGER